MTACPACAEPARPDTERCGGCGWVLRAGPFLGRADPAALDRFRSRLDAAAAAHDLAAAVRSGASQTDAAALGLRGGAPDWAAWAAAVQAHGTTSRPGAPPADPDLAGVLSRLVGRATNVLHVVGLSADGLTHQRVVTDPWGFPGLDGPMRTIDWPGAGLATGRARRRFQLAGGVGEGAPDRAAFDRSVVQALPGIADGECVVLAPPPDGGCSTARWPSCGGSRPCAR